MLTDIADALPLGVADSGVWISNPAAALELAGLRPAEGDEEWLSWTPGQHEEYEKAQHGIPDTAIYNVMMQFGPRWEHTFGFGSWDVMVMAETGEMEWAGFELNLLSGQFDRGQVREKLLGLGYQVRSYAGLQYLTLPEGTRVDLDWISAGVVNANVRSVFTDGQTLLTAPTAERLEGLLSVRIGEMPSLGHHPAFSDLVVTMPDPLFIAILSRKAVLEPEHPRFRQFKPLSGWGSLGEWKAMSAGFSRTSPEADRISVSLWYENKARAQEAAGEMTRRFKTFQSEQANRPLDELQGLCEDHWHTEVLDSSKGAVLSVSCELDSGPASRSLGGLLLNILFDGTLAFLVG